MSEQLTPDTQAILLLAAPLLTGSKASASVKPLTLSEYKTLVQLLRDAKLTPSALLGTNAPELIARFAKTDALRARMTALLERGLLLSEAVESWAARSIWVCSRADEAYPARWKAKLGQDAPPFVFGCGDAALLERGGVAVVGSRDADARGLSFAETIGRCAAELGRAVVSGGARGVDQAAVSAATKSDGGAVVVLPDQLARAAVSQSYREDLRAGRVVLLSPYDPQASFNVGHAMQRNKLIYALADVAFVASSAFETGGTWSGAVEQLETYRFAPVYVRAPDSSEKGLAGLQKRGALACPADISAASLRSMLADAAVAPRVAAAPKQLTLDDAAPVR